MESLFDACMWAVNDYSGGDNDAHYSDFCDCCIKNKQDPEEVVAVCERAVDESRETDIKLINTPANARRATWAVAVLTGVLS